MEFAERVALVIEDDPDIRLLLETVLAQAGFTVHAASNGGSGVKLASQVDPLVITLDVNLPDIDGFEVARRVRTNSDAYIIMLTARGDEIDTLSGLDVGADDYMTKPFRPRELRARVEAMLRRPRSAGRTGADLAPSPAVTPTVATASAAAPAPTGDDARETGRHAAPAGSAAASAATATPAHDVINGLRVDRDARIVEVDGADVALTRSEFDILSALWVNVGKVVTKHNLVRALWGDEYDVGTLVTPSDHRSVEVHMANLRRKIGEDTSSPRWIDTVRGVGYRLNAPRATPSR
ncbi:response regulator transcription factor [Litorihabitans aurantiacus]|uniref:Sensory transduction protein n=1 Tax=Litorihabitans aurantiacus TaxID=1930061 RepID=A0AA37XCX6_9MICO|nr:response regulator transcription factor [Litorihabitans aurantiacus]GMA30435.1 putative sensory transduction protein [Litorihabitans aurantiacus]